MTTISVVGASGRVGSALVAHLADRFEVVPVARRAGESPTALAARAADGVAVVVNAAGVAHVESVDDDALDRLQAGNVELPLALADAALAAGAALVHVSSAKAQTPDRSPYAASKRAGDDALAERFGPAFERAGLPLVVIRPLAMLFPPLDAGKVRHLRRLRHLPPALVPAIRLPVLSPATFLSAVERATADAAAHAVPGCTIRSFGADERGTLRDVAEAFRAAG